MDRHGLLRANGVTTPLPVSADVVSAKPDEPLLDAYHHAEYRAQVGGLLYAAVCTRPDISKSVSLLAQQLHAPTARHSKLLKRLIRFVGSTSTKRLFYTGGKPLTPYSLAAWVDADWGRPGDEEVHHGFHHRRQQGARVLEDQEADDHCSVLSGG